jgi:hypothetical protein
VASDEEVFEVHQTGDGQPTFNPCRTKNVETGATALEVANPQIELHSKAGVQSHKQPLHNLPDAL